MERYYFLFALALVWTVFAVVNDIRKREVANWLSFSLIAFALAYRAFYASAFGDWGFFGFGVLGFLVFFGLANFFYYTRTFAGGDAKLLMGLGIALPFESFSGMAIDIMGFFLVLFFIGAIYSLTYSLFLAFGSWKTFGGEFFANLKKYASLFLILGIFGAILLFLMEPIVLGGITFAFFVLAPVIYVYLVSLDKCCMTKWISPGNLTEGDWLEREVSVYGSRIRKSVHGLSWEQIKLLRKAGKKVLIKQGIPFIPAFLMTWMFMGFFYLVLKLDFYQLLSYLF